MLLLIVGGFEKDGGNLFIALFSGLAGKVGLAVSGLGFAGKSG